MNKLNQELEQFEQASTKKVAIQRNEAFPMFKKTFSENIGKVATRKVRRRKSETDDSSYEQQTILIEKCFDSSVLVSRIIIRNQKEQHVLRFCINYSSLLTNEEIIIF